MAGGGGDDVVAELFDDADRLAVDHAVGDDGGEIVGRTRPSFLGQVVEVADEIGDRCFDALHDVVGALELGVLGREQLLGEAQHPREVALGQAEDRQDHVQRVVHRDVGGEVALAVELDHPLQRASRQLGKSSLELREVLGQEPIGGQIPVLPVLDTIHLDERLHEVTVLCTMFVRDPSSEDRAWGVQEHGWVLFDVEHVGVAGEDVERVEVGMFDVVHRVLAPEQCGAAVPVGLVGVGGRGQECVPGFLE